MIRPRLLFASAAVLYLTAPLLVSVQQRDPSVLKRETLQVRYLNRTSVAVRGIFRCGDTPPVKIADSRIDIGNSRITRPSCHPLDAAHPTPLDYATVPD